METGLRKGLWHSPSLPPRSALCSCRPKPPTRTARTRPTRSRPRTAGRQPVERVGRQRRRRRRASRASPPTSASTGADDLSSRSTRPPTRYRIDIYRLGYYGGHGARKVATIHPSAALPQTSQPACLTDPATGLVDCGNWAVSASWTVPATASRASTSPGSSARRTRAAPATSSFVVRNDGGQLRRSSSRPRTPPGRPTTATAATASTAARARRRPAGRPSLQGQLQPALHDARRTAPAGLGLQRRVPDGPLAGAERVRRQLLHGRRHRPARGRDRAPQGLPLGRPRRVLVEAAAGERREGPGRRSPARRPRPPRVLQRQRGLLEDPLGDRASTAPARRLPHARLLQGDARGRQDRSLARVDGDLA